MSNPVQLIAEYLGKYLPSEEMNLLPYCFTDTKVMFGSPLKPVIGLDSIRCRFLAPRAKKFSSLGGGACFLSNRNTGGEIILRYLPSFSVAFTELINASGVSVPIIMSDVSSGGTATVIGTACRLVDVGEFAREQEISLVEFKFQSDRMTMFHGLRLQFIET